MKVKAGDLVMTVKASPCCGNASDIGRVFVADEVYENLARCGHCEKAFGFIWVVKPRHGLGQSLSRVIKVDPPALSESTEYLQEIEVQS